MAQQDEIARLLRQAQSQAQAKLEKIQGEKLSMQVHHIHMSIASAPKWYTEWKTMSQSLCLWEGLENELQDIRGQIKEKTRLLNTKDIGIFNLSKGSSPSSTRQSHCVGFDLN